MATAGASVSIETHWNHRAIVYRSTDTRDELQDVVRSWDALPAPSGNNCRPNQAWSGQIGMPGPGEQQVSMRQWFLDKAFDVRERDVISIVSGPESPLLLKVHVPVPVTAPIVRHHWEVDVEVWYGSLVEPTMGS